jgi:hypothetical protein
MKARPSPWLVIKDDKGTVIGKTARVCGGRRGPGLSTGTAVRYYAPGKAYGTPLGIGRLVAASLVWMLPAFREEGLRSLRIFDVIPLVK